MTRYIRKFRQIEKYLEIALKSIPIGVVLFFVGSFFLNLGYFRKLGLSLMSLLSLSDYYEGSLFSIYYIGIILFSLFLLNTTQSSILLLYKMVGLCTRFFWYYILILIKSIAIKRKSRLIMEKIRQENNSSDKKRELDDIIKEEKKLFATASNNFYSGIKKFTKAGIKLLFLLLMGFILITSHLYCVYIYNWGLLVIIGILYISFKIVQKHKISKIGFLSILFLFYVNGMYELGLMLVSTYPGKISPWNFKICSISKNMYVNINEEQYVFMRSLNRGILVKKDEEIFFFRWEDVQFLYQQNEKIENAKK